MPDLPGLFNGHMWPIYLNIFTVNMKNVGHHFQDKCSVRASGLMTFYDVFMFDFSTCINIKAF